MKSLLLLIAALPLLAQNPPANPPTTTTDPTGKACAANSLLNYIPSGALFTCDATGHYAAAGGGAATVNVNGSSVSSPNFNGTTPAAPAGDTNIIFQVSGSSVSGYLSNFVPGAGVLTGPGTAQALPASLTSGGVLCNTSTSQMTTSVLLAANAIVLGGGAGACPTATTALPNGTTATTQSAGDNSTKVATTAYVSTALTTPVYNTQSSAVATNISPATMVTSPSGTHSYAFHWVISLTAAGTSCTGNTTVTLNAIFADPNNASPATLALGTVTLATGGNGTLGFIAEGADTILAASATAVQYSTTSYTLGTGCSPGPSYQVSPALVQLW